jgi:hypothetical protein
MIDRMGISDFLGDHGGELGGPAAEIPDHDLRSFWAEAEKVIGTQGLGEEDLPSPDAGGFEPDFDLDEGVHARWAAETGEAFLEWAAKKAATLTLDAVAPPLGRVADIGFKVIDVAKSLRALDGDDPRVIVPVHQLIPGLDFEINVPLGGTIREAVEHSTCFIAPDEPSWTGGWAFEASEASYGAGESERRPKDADQPSADARAAPVRRRGPQSNLRHLETVDVGYSCEIDMGDLGLANDTSLRVRQLRVLACQYAEVLRASQQHEGVTFLALVDAVTGEGIWMRLFDPRQRGDRTVG